MKTTTKIEKNSKPASSKKEVVKKTKKNIEKAVVKKTPVIAEVKKEEIVNTTIPVQKSDKPIVVKKPKAVKLKKVKVKKVKTKKVKKVKVPKLKKIKALKVKIPKTPKVKLAKEKTQKTKKIDVTKLESSFPEFKNIPEMKNYCVANSLNLVDGYILATKLKKTEFLAWMELNKSFIKPIGIINNGVDKKSNTDKAKSLFGNNEGGVQENLIGVDKTVDNSDSIKTSQQINKEGLIAYGNDILSCIKTSPSVVFRGGLFGIAELESLIASASKLYTYEIKNEGGMFLLLKDAVGNEVRVPESGFLPM